jgi:O-antigen/teichoic acid export membrane protein
VNKTASYGIILRATFLMGAASAVHIIMGAARIKMVAVILGPAGVGLIGMLQNMLAATTLFGICGIDTIGTREVASTTDDKRRGTLAWSLLMSLMLSGIVTGAFFYIFRNQILVALNLQSVTDRQMLFVAFAIVLSVSAAAQLSLLNGLREVKLIALLKILSAISATVLCAFAFLGDAELAIQYFIISVPIFSFIFGHIFLMRIRNALGGQSSLLKLFPVIRSLAAQGAPIMLASLSILLSQLIVRSIINKKLGILALGQFEAAWTISMTYLGFVLGAMATDYFPRLCAQKTNAEAVQLVNEQTEVALMLLGPVLILMMALSPLVITILYTSEFMAAVDVLRWQIFGDFLKILSWPIAFVLLAQGMGKSYFAAELTGAIVFVAVVYFGISNFGTSISGIGFLCIYVAYLPIVAFFAYKKIGFTWFKNVQRQVAFLFMALFIVYWVSEKNQICGSIIGVIMTASLMYKNFTKLWRAFNGNGQSL